MSVTADVTLCPDLLDAAVEYQRFATAPGGEGAIACFTGIARSMSGEGSAVLSLYLDHHPRLTLVSMEGIADAARRQFDILRLRIVHRCGEVRPEEAIVFVAAAAYHRRAAIEAVDYMMDRLKTDAVFWKRENRADGSRWIEPTDADRVARSRWGVERGGN